MLFSDWIGQTDKLFSRINLCITLSFRKGNYTFHNFESEGGQNF